MNPYISQKENNDFIEACEAEILCDAKYCPYMNGTVSRLGACEGDFCKEEGERVKMVKKSTKNCHEVNGTRQQQ